VEYNIVVSNAQQEEKVTTGGLDLDGRGLLTKKKKNYTPSLQSYSREGPTGFPSRLSSSLVPSSLRVFREPPR